jgi:hypothetical protein
MRARHEAIWNDRPTSRCKAGGVAVIGSGIRSTYGQLRRRRALDRVSMGGYEIKPSGLREEGRVLWELVIRWAARQLGSFGKYPVKLTGKPIGHSLACQRHYAKLRVVRYSATACPALLTQRS